MSYTTRYICNFSDLYGMDYRLEIMEDGYRDLPSDILLGVGGFRLTYSGNNRGVSSLIMGSKVEFEMMITNDNEKQFIKDLALSGDRDFICQISRDEGAGHYQFWIGYIIADLVTFEDAPFPFSFNVVASDGFGLAREIDYTNLSWLNAGKPTDAKFRHTELIAHCFWGIGLSEHLDHATPFMIGDTLLKESDQVVYTTTPQLYNTRVNAKAFAEYDTSTDDVNYNVKSVYEVLEEICKVWSARVFQYNGQFWFIPVANYLDNNADFYPMDKNAQFITNSHTPLNLFLDSSKYHRIAGGSFDFYPPLAKSCVEYKYYYDPLLGDSSEELDCGVNTAQGNITFFDPLVSNFTSYGDNSATIRISYDYKTLWGFFGGGTVFPPEPSAVLMNFDVTVGDYRCVREFDYIDDFGVPTFKPAFWAKNYEHTFKNLTAGQTVLDISVMECFTMPETSQEVRVIVDGVEYFGVNWTYDKDAKTITFNNVPPDPIVITDNSVVTVVFNFQQRGRFQVWMQGVDIRSFPYTNSSTHDIVLAIPPTDQEGQLYVAMQGGSHTCMQLRTVPDDWDVYTNVVTVDLNTHPIQETPTGTAWRVAFDLLKITNITVESDLSAQPTNSSNTVKECLENLNDSAETVSVNMITGDMSAHTSDSNIEIYSTSNQWVKSKEWQVGAVGLTYTGSLANCINTMNLHLQENPALRYNGSITRVGADLFSPVLGFKTLTFNDTHDNLFFGGGTLIASECIWNVQMIQLG